MHETREARANEAEALSQLLVSSITELCSADHHDDPAIIAQWTANKTPENVARWIKDPRGTIFVAEVSGALAGVAGISRTGYILLNYVAPEFRFQGISDSLLSRLEDTARIWCLAEASLESTETARRFYLARGWKENGPAVEAFGMPGYPMIKPLVLD